MGCVVFAINEEKAWEIRAKGGVAAADDGYLDLMAAVVTQQVEDAYDTRVPLMCVAARYYIFNEGPGSL